jgi:hypothetical protein
LIPLAACLALIVIAVVAGALAGGDDDKTDTAGTAPPTEETITSTTERAPTTTAGPADPAAPDASPYVEGFGDLSVVSLPAGEPDALTIIAAGTTVTESGSVDMIVRNNTREDIGRIEVTGTARDDAGKLVGSGSSQGFEPVIVAPGEIAYGYVYFDISLAGSTLEFSFNIDSRPPADIDGVPVTISELNNTGDQIIGTVTNETDGDVTGPISVNAICFGPDGSITDNLSTYVEPSDVPAGGTGSFAIDVYGDPCPVGLIAGSGYDF